MRRKRKLVLFLGAPGAGKGERMKKILQLCADVARLGMSDMLRSASEIMSVADYETRIKFYMDSGKLVPDDTVISVANPYLSGLGGDNHIFWDGFPRTKAQAELFLQILVDLEKCYEVVVVLVDTPIAVCRDRLIGPNATGRGRVDDTPESVEGRFLDWENEGLAAIACLEASGVKVYRVEGGETPEEGARNIINALALDLAA